MCRHSFRVILLSLFFTGCTVKSLPVSQNKISLLAQELQGLKQGIPQKEAERLSRDIFNETARLTKEFKLTSPPLFHNFLVNVGLRKKGLCYHWSDALYYHFYYRNYASFTFKLGGANIGKYFSEHNAMIVTAKKGKFEDGVIIDPWRNSGELYFSKVREDREYAWKHRVDREFEGQ